MQSLLRALRVRYGVDLRDYARPFIARRVATAVQSEGLASAAELERRLLDDPACMERFLLSVTVHVTTLFRDPAFYLAFRRLVVPMLRELSFMRIWVAGCSTGEEAYSIAILLEEEALYDRCRLYATDVSERVVSEAKRGIYLPERSAEFVSNYREAGGRRSLADFQIARYGRLIFRRSLKRNLVFSRHDLVSDEAFNQFHVILCRNVMIYFSAALCRRVHGLFYRCLTPCGVLALGSRESIRFTPHEACYRPLDPTQPIYSRTDDPCSRNP